MIVYRLVNTKNNYTLGIFLTKEKVDKAFNILKETVGWPHMIIYREELDHIYTENIDAK